MRTIKRNIVGAFIFSTDNKLLLGKSIKGGVYADVWIIPGGGIEASETHKQALSREVLEETGIDITDADITAIEGVLTGQSEKVLRENAEKVLVDMVFFNYKVDLSQNADEIQLVTEDDFVEAKWFDIDILSTLPMSPPSITTLKKLGYL